MRTYTKIYVHLQFAIIAFVSKRSNKSEQAPSSSDHREVGLHVLFAMLCPNSLSLYSFAASYFVKQGITAW